LDFLEPIEQQAEAVLDEKGGIRAPLYKVLLFIKIAQAIKGGVLNLQHSYKYRSLDDYLIPKHDWETHRDVYLKRADLTEYAHCQPTLHALATQLDQQYHQTNQRILAGDNPHVHFRKVADRPPGGMAPSTFAPPKPRKRIANPFSVSYPKNATSPYWRFWLPSIASPTFSMPLNPGGLNIPAPNHQTEHFLPASSLRADGRQRLWLLHWDPQDCQHFIGYC